MRGTLRRWRVGALGLACSATLFVSPATNATAAVSPTVQRARAIPRPVLAGAETLVVQRVGMRFYQKYMTLDSSACRFSDGTETTRTPHWTLIYRVRNGEGPPNAIAIDVDGSGRRFGPQPVRGTPNCLHEPTACEFALDEEAARSAACKAGLAPGNKPWKVQFQFVYGSWQRYAWTVQSTHGDGPCDAKGESYTIDPDTGQVLERSEWFTICCPAAPQSILFAPDTTPGPVQR